MSELSQQEAADRIWKTLDDADAVMLTERFSGGLRARPMAPFADPEGHAIYFVTEKDTSKVEEVKANPEVGITVSKPVANTYASITGDAAVVDDRAKMNELWNKWLNTWFDGPTDPKAVLIRVTPREGELWDGDAMPVAQIKMIMAERAEQPDVGDRKRASL